MSYLQLPIELNAETLIEEIYAEMESRFEGWRPDPGSPETWVIRAVVYRLIVPLALLTVDVADQVFAKFGEQLAQVPLITATPATVASTWKVADEAGYTIKAGWEVDIAVDGSTKKGFRVVSDVVIPAGKKETAAGEVTLEAIEPGSESNELTGPASLVDAITYVTSDPVLVGETSGGVDEEEPLTYLGRLTETMQIQSPRPIRARDVAILLRSIPGVQRVGVLDNYNAVTHEGEKEKTLSYCPLDASGNGVSGPILAECEALLEEKREINFLFFGVAPTQTKVNINFEVVPAAGYSQAQANAAAAAALIEAMSPANFGRDLVSESPVPTVWIVDGKIRYQDLVTIVNNQPAIDHYTVLKVAKEGSGLGTADVTLPGDFPLPKPGTIHVGS